MRIVLLGAVLVVASFGVRDLAGAHIVLNYTASVPVGLYLRKAEGEYAAFCLPEDAARNGLAAGLDMPKGDCPGGLSPVLKRMVRPSREHPLVYGPDGFRNDGELMSNTQPKERSSSGVKLEHFAYGLYTSGLWPISSFSRDSYDARYYGPINPDQIRYRASPLWIW